MGIFLILLAAYLYDPRDWLHLPPMARVVSITADPFYVYIICPDGVFAWDKGKERLSHTITRLDGIPEGLKLGGYDPETGRLWVLSQDRLTGYHPFTRSSYGTQNPLPEATSIGIGPSWLYLASRDKILKGDKQELRFIRVETVPAEVVWYGERSPYKAQDYLFLTPYHYTDEGFRRYEITCLYEEPRLLWVGTDGYGIFGYDLLTRGSRHLRFGPAQAQTELIYADDQGLWFLHPYHLSCYSPHLNTWSYYDRARPLYPQGKGLLSFNLWDLVRRGMLLSLTQDGPRGWVGSTDGLWLWDVNSGGLIRWAFQDTAVHKTLLVGDTLFVATEYGLWRTPPGGRPESVKDPYNKLSFGVRNMARAGKNLYLATQSGVVVQDSAGSFKLLTLAGVDLIRPLRALAGYGRYLFLVPWCGRLILYDVEEDHYERLDLKYCLLSDEVTGLWADATYLWIATPKGLSRLNYHAIISR